MEGVRFIRNCSTVDTVVGVEFEDCVANDLCVRTLFLSIRSLDSRPRSTIYGPGDFQEIACDKKQAVDRAVWLTGRQRSHPGWFKGKTMKSLCHPRP
jgi:hypothetical protein